MSRQYWLLKSEPDAYSIDDLVRDDVEGWDGIRNYQARNNLRAMKVGDLALFYHSRITPPLVVGLCEIVKEAYVDETAWDPEEKYYDKRCKPGEPRWSMVDVQFVEKFKNPVSLKELKANPKLADMKVTQKGSRLSVQPVTEEEFLEVLGMAKADYQLTNVG